MKQADHIVLLAAGIKQDAGGRWVSTNLTEEDNMHGAPGGTLRIDAATVLLRNNPSAIIMTGGARGFDVREGVTSDRPPLAEILRDELLECGIADERIILERNSNTTYQELQEIERFAAELGLERLVILTSRWHIPRLCAMIEVKFSNFRRSVTLEIVAAEEVLIAENEKKWRTFIDDAYCSQWMVDRIRKEQDGIRQIHAGTYTFR